MSTATSSNFVTMSDLTVFLEQDNQAGFSEALELLGKRFQVHGCIFWGVEKKKAHKGDATYVLGEWLGTGDFSGMWGLPLGDSFTGEAILTEIPVILEDAFKDTDHSAWNMCQKWLHENNVVSMAAFPLRFINNDLGALSLYWKERKQLTEGEHENLLDLAKILPLLYKSIQDRMSFKLVKESNRLTQLEKFGTDFFIAEQRTKARLGDVVNLISRTFYCINTSLYLIDPEKAQKSAQHVARSWHRQGYREEIPIREKEPGLIAWVLRNGKSLKIFDLREFDEQKEEFTQKYPGLVWAKPKDLEDQVKIHKDMRRFGKVLPPISIMVVPLLKEGKCLGAICCFISHKPPFLFSDREETLLTILADQISEYWSSWLSSREEKEENQSWWNLLNGMELLNDFARNDLKKQVIDETALLKEGLKVAKKAVKRADILDIRLRDPEKDELYFAEMLGNTWNQTYKGKLKKRNRRFTLKGDPRSSTGAWVFKNNKTYHYKEGGTGTRLTDEPRYDATFKAAKELISSPIHDGEKVRGVLDLRTTNVQGFPRHAVNITDILAQQIGLHLSIYKAAQAMQKSLVEKEELQEQSKKTFEDFCHQVRTPVFGATKRIRDHLRDEISRNKRAWNLQALRGLCSKASRVVKSLNMFADLTESGGLIANMKRLKVDDFTQMITESAADTEIMIPPRRNIKFDVNRSSFSVLRELKIAADIDLLEHAIGNLFDNAAKYSFDGHKIHVFAEKEAPAKFSITITNVGTHIDKSEVPFLTDRLFRGTRSEAVSREGRGIGLWIVNHIMKAHNGTLVISPTTASGLNKFRLVFPPNTVHIKEK